MTNPTFSEFMKALGTSISKGRMNQSELLEKILVISQKPGFYLVYTFSIIFSQYFASIKDLISHNPEERYSINELAIIAGLILKNPINFSSKGLTEKEMLTMMEELWGSFQEFHGVLLGQGILQEALFYSDSGAFDFQYLDFFLHRYSRDADWIMKNKGFNLEDAISICNAILENRKNNGIINIEGENLKERSMSLFQKLCFSVEDIYEKIPDISPKEINNFIESFSCSPGTVNVDFNGIGSKNQIYAKPIIKIDTDNYFLPLGSLLCHALYREPIEWMREEDPGYFRTLGSKNRGDTSEDMVYEILKPIIGEGKIFKNIDVWSGKRKVTDADVLCFIGDKAIVVQVKSKTLTLEARGGNIEKIEDDYKKAIQDSYDQGVLVRDAMIGGAFTFKNKDGNPFQAPSKIDEAFVLCVTGDAFPASAFLGKLLAGDPGQTEIVIPMAISIFDLDVIAFYLKDPFELLFYLKQRYLFASRTFVQSELAILAKHLKEGLYTEEGTMLMLDESIQMFITPHFLYAKGKINNKKGEIIEEPFSSWKNEDFNNLISMMKASMEDGITDAVLLLYSLSGSARDEIFKAIVMLRNDLYKYPEKPYKSCFFPVDDKIIGVMCSRDLSKLTSKMEEISRIRKYGFKSSQILCFGVPYYENEAIWTIYFDKSSWIEDIEMQAACDKYMGNVKTSYIDIKTGKIGKPGRNDSCPCGAGMKFKKCHGK